MATIHVDGTPYEADPKQNLLHACLSHGLDLPYFCWHPALGSVGACRQCAVKQFRDEQDAKGRLVMACMTPVADGARLSIADEEAATFRAAVVEGLMLNHPHDCPVCDEGGECHLQDMTVMTGHRCRHYDFDKRTFVNQDLGSFLHHEMNRCIQCYRCVRYYREYAGGHDLNSFRLRNTVYFGRHEDGPLESEFSGNLVEVCPTGVFTDATLRHHYTRKWDLQMAPSVCVHCAVGCNTSPGERYGTLRRVANRYNGDVNGYFLCDRGRFGYEFVNDGRRIGGAGANRSPVSRDEAVRRFAVLAGAGQRTIGIGSPRTSLEANFALRELVGPERFFAGVADAEHHLQSLALRLLRESPARTPSLRDVERCDAVLVLGEDVTNTAPVVALALRQAARQQPMRTSDAMGIPRWLDQAVREVAQDATGPLFIAATSATKLDDVATATYRAAPDDLARLGFAVAQALDATASPVTGGLPGDLAARIAGSLRGAERPLVVTGLSAGSEAVLHAAANVARALCGVGRPASLLITAPECNSMGLALLNARPMAEAREAIRDGRVDAAIVLENDLYRRMPPNEADELLGRVRVIAIDHTATRTSERADLVLPAGTFAESDGTLVSFEVRAQRYFQVFVPKGDIQASWRWLRDGMQAMGRPKAAGWLGLDDVLAAMVESLPALASVRDVAPKASSPHGARQTHRNSGRTATLAHLDVHEPKPPDDPDAPLNFSMEGQFTQHSPAAQPFVWAPGWNSVQATTKFQAEVGGHLLGGDPGVRLIEPSGSGGYGGEVPLPFEPRRGECLLLPLHHIFGSEELSFRSLPIASRAPQPYVALHPEDAARLRVEAGTAVDIGIAGTVVTVVAVLRPDLPLGTAGVPCGMPPFVGLPLPSWSGLSPAETEPGRAPRALTAGGKR